MKLESSIYTQERAIDEADKKLRQSTPQKRKVKRAEVKIPEKPNLSVDKGKNGCAGFVSSIFFLGGFIWLIVAILSKNFFVIFISIPFFVIGGMMIKTIIENLSSAKEQEKGKQEQYAKYKKEVESLSRRKKYAERTYQIELKDAERAFEYDTKNYKIATEAVNQMQKTLLNTKDTLQKFYSVEMLYPKYRNLVAVSTIYEYFASGRVDTLEGPNGAYNLYESELRQNIIIGKLDVIISQLDQIKTNQYALYNELKETNQIINGIRNDVSMLVRSTHEIADATKITALCSKVTAQNTEILKWLAVINT